MRTAVKTARLAMVGSALMLMVSGMIMWGGTGDQLGLVHVGLGLVLTLSLWTIAVVAARAGVSRSIVGLAVIWSLGAIALGVAQGSLLAATPDLPIRALHLVTAMGMVAWGQGLVLLIRRSGARGRRPAPALAPSLSASPAWQPTPHAQQATDASVIRKVAATEVGGPWRPRF